MHKSLVGWALSIAMCLTAIQALANGSIEHAIICVSLALCRVELAILEISK